MKKNLFIYVFVSLVALLMLAPSSYAQYKVENGIATSKTVTGPDENGQYMIDLESFVTGNVSITHESTPLDIVLVLDYSWSMQIVERELDWGWRYNVVNSLDPLRKSVATFVNIVKGMPATEDNLGGHRIAFVLYSGDYFSDVTGLNKLINVGDLTTSFNQNSFRDVVNPGYGTFGPYDSGQVYYNGVDLVGHSVATTGTGTSLAMAEAKSILDAEEENYSNNPSRKQIVVLFTDGEPNIPEGSSYDLSAAYNIKHSTIYPDALVYSIGLVSGISQSNLRKVMTYLAYTSSDFPNASTMPSSSGYVPRDYSGDHCFLVDDDQKLKDIFETIGHQAEQSSSAIDDAAVVTVDVVSASFTLPPNAQTSNIKLQLAPCDTFSINGTDTTYLFGTPVPAGDTVTVDGNKLKDNIISVQGFDFAAHFCGVVKDGDKTYTRKGGYKLIINIPIKPNPSAVGGKETATNEPGSGIYVTVTDPKTGKDTTIRATSFQQPITPRPVNIWIRKSGLARGESAKFKILRTPWYHIGPEAEESWRKTWGAFDEHAAWSEYTTVVLTGDGQEEPGYVEQKLNGLDMNYYYKVVEDSWSWSYQTTLTSYNNTYQQKSNPFTFLNAKTDASKSIHHAESKAINAFGTEKSAKTIDSREFFNTPASSTPTEGK